MVPIKTSECIKNYFAKNFDQYLPLFLSAVITATPSSSSQLCRYFPACKKMECPFYHPKVRTFSFPEMNLVWYLFTCETGRSLANWVSPPPPVLAHFLLVLSWQSFQILKLALSVSLSPFVSLGPVVWNYWKSLSWALGGNLAFASQFLLFSPKHTGGFVPRCQSCGDETQEHCSRPSRLVVAPSAVCALKIDVVFSCFVAQSSDLLSEIVAWRPNKRPLLPPTGSWA